MQTMAAFELNEQLLEDNKAAYFVPDLVRLKLLQYFLCILFSVSQIVVYAFALSPNF